MVKKIAILTNGGDAPGLNAVIRVIVKTARTHGVESYGYIEGYQGLLDNNYVKLDLQSNASDLIAKVEQLLEHQIVQMYLIIK